MMTERLMYQVSKDLIKAHAAQVTSSIEVENGHINEADFEDLFISGTYVIVYETKDRLIAGTETYAKINKLPRDFNNLRNVDIEENTWLVFDQPVYEDNRLVAW
jgi:hypothetical protein